MLQITIPEMECFDESTNEFLYLKPQTIRLEHSLVSTSKWEAKWLKPFLSTKDKTIEETIDYVRCMSLTQNVDPDTYKHLTDDNLNDIREYIDAPMTATWFPKTPNSPNRRVITSEVIYAWMVEYGIPFECQKWHLNRLVTLIRICNLDQQPQKKMSQMDLMRRNNALNEARKAMLHTNG